MFYFICEQLNKEEITGITENFGAWNTTMEASVWAIEHEFFYHKGILYRTVLVLEWVSGSYYDYQYCDPVAKEKTCFTSPW